MKVLLIDTGGYKLWAELADAFGDEKAFVLSSQWADAKKPDDERVQFRCMLDAIGIRNLKNLMEAFE
jgi:hypothetical protein